MPLRPLLFGEILDGAFQTIRRNAAAMLGAALLAQTLATVVGEVAAAETESGGESIGLWLTGMAPPEVANLGGGLLIGAAILGLVSFFISVVLQGVMVVPVARSVLNQRTGFKKMWTLSRSRIGALLALGGLQILAGVALGVVLLGGAFLLATAMGGMSALIIVPLFLGSMVAVLLISIRLLLTPAAIVVEEQGVLDGLRRSWQLTRHNWWRIFGIVLVISLLIGIISQIVLVPISLASGGFSSVIAPHGGDDAQRALSAGLGIATIIVTAVIGAVGYAFQTSVMGLLYMDLRMRKEGLDLALQRQLESGNDDDGVPGRGVAPEAHPAGRPPDGGWAQSPYGPHRATTRHRLTAHRQPTAPHRATTRHPATTRHRVPDERAWHCRGGLARAVRSRRGHAFGIRPRAGRGSRGAGQAGGQPMGRRGALKACLPGCAA
ncbi:DUF7847 domain-containing protein [Arthrobacter sp. SPG23]|uniref:DUF7847 domain-containing protein n=1 Tax=Arthrobacter sp. SPG23 TaxID=1610703 RepID=UPI0011846D98|nr:glycerophosphoryl diester phosphodiesterase membrane domain-containing protein [Arthrobacter sp. SPG23]